ncbi:hypothetical protein [Saccharopolyspora sp. NPDC049426]|uniref:hypothetical protein n=1 Tax=Saccharopolyspora sp. NPDC049426 TaxID=3155652 RepID=UPI003432E471
MFLMAVLPQFVDREAGGVVAQMLALGLAGALLQLTSDSTWGLTASAARTRLGRSPRRLTHLTRAGGATMIGLGITAAPPVDRISSRLRGRTSPRGGLPSRRRSSAGRRTR